MASPGSPSGDSSEAEALAFLGWVKAVSRDPETGQSTLSREVDSVEDLCDGVALLEVLAGIDSQYFRNPHGAETKDNWVLRIGTLKRLYKLMMQYYSEVLNSAPQVLPTPDLNAIARSSDRFELCKLCRLAVGLAVQSAANDVHIAAIQTLAQGDQHQLMMAIEQVIGTLNAAKPSEEEREADVSAVRDLDDEAYYASRTRGGSDAALEAARAEKETLEKVYMQLLEEHRTLQTAHEDMRAEKDDAVRDLAQVRAKADDAREAHMDVLMRQDIERLKGELRRSEDNLAEAESEVERLGNVMGEMTRKVEDLQRKADEGARLKDQVDEYKHAADKLQRTENVIEKYKKKLEEGADVRRQVKLLEDQNAELVDRNAALEDEYKRVSAFKPLMDSYKSQIAELESKASNLTRDLNAARYETEQAVSRLRASEETRAREKEEMELYAERIRELEIGGAGAGKRRKKVADASSDPVNGAESLAAADESMASDDLDDEDIGGELDDALAGTTMTDLKIQVRKLARELEGAKANKADASRLLVLENLLEDAQRMRSRYEADWLKEHQQKLVLQSELEAIREGKSSLGDGPEAAFALRKRLNETVEELDQAKRDMSKLQVDYDRASRELTIAKSDLTLVDKDQVEILQSLRESVSIEKNALETELSRLRSELRTSEDRVKMQMEQVNSLLLEKVELQTEGIGQREKMLERERKLGELRASLAGKELPEEARELMTRLQEARNKAEADAKVSHDKLGKAKLFIKQQDRMLKEKEREVSIGNGSSISDEEMSRMKRIHAEEISRLKRERALMASAYHDLGLRLLRDHGHARAHRSGAGGGGFASNSGGRGGGGGAPGGSSGTPGGGMSAPPASWLAQQRKMVATGLTWGRR